MKIRRDYSQPFFREPKRHRLRNVLLVTILGVLLGAGIVWQWASVELMIDSVFGEPATPTPLPSELAMRAVRHNQLGDFAAAETLLAVLWRNGRIISPISMNMASF